MKKLIIVAVCIALLAVVAGCAGNNNANVTPPPATPSTPEPEPIPTTPVHPGPEPIHTGAKFENSDDHVEMTVSTNHTPDVPRGIIEVLVSIRNKGTEAIAYVQGSGSNMVPDAVVADLGGLVASYKPAIQTMDYQTHLLEPGEFLVFTLTFAPFHYATEQEFPMPVPPGSGLDYFEGNEEFNPAMAGPVEGYVNFTYHLEPGEDREGDGELGALAYIEEGESRTLSVEFTVEIGE